MLRVFLLLLHCVVCCTSWATIGDVAATMTRSMGNITLLIGSLSYVVGLGFFIACLFKFKQHRDNPTQVSLGAPFSYLVIAILLVFMPSFILESGGTFFGANLRSSGASGSGFSNIANQ
ncbi:MAG: type IV secretion protein IcmD [Pseudomonadota bacterium]|nr:type IV secretion protein IcmD [Pseudomonadota bacterium]